jgi:hypothetical protein
MIVALSDARNSTAVEDSSGQVGQPRIVVPSKALIIVLTLSQDFEPFGYRDDRHDLGPAEGPGACREEKQVH